MIYSARSTTHVIDSSLRRHSSRVNPPCQLHHPLERRRDASPRWTRSSLRSGPALRCMLREPATGSLPAELQWRNCACRISHVRTGSAGGHQGPATNPRKRTISIPLLCIPLPTDFQFVQTTRIRGLPQTRNRIAYTPSHVLYYTCTCR
jgi:hypothetical protein